MFGSLVPSLVFFYISLVTSTEAFQPKKSNTHFHPYSSASTLLTSSSSSSSSTSLKATTEFGKKISVTSEKDLPPLNPDWIQAAVQPFAWEVNETTDTADTNTAELLSDDTEDEEDWKNGQRWYATRTALMELWVLPHDMSNGSWDHYAEAAIRAEEKVLTVVPQFLRLHAQDVVASANIVLHELGLPPALLRKEPLLLTMSPDRLRGGFETIRLSMATLNTDENENVDGTDTNDDSTIAAATLDACRDTEGLFVEAATNWIPPSLSDATTTTTTTTANDSTTTTTTTMNKKNKNAMMDFVQTSFDNEVPVEDVPSTYQF